jgi:hypothetical protein
MAKARLVPLVTVTAPDGVIEPLAPAEAVSVKVTGGAAETLNKVETTGPQLPAASLP